MPVHVVSYEAAGDGVPFTRYTLDVSMSGAPSTWSVVKRYSDFVCLHRTLRSAAPVSSAFKVKLPRKRFGLSVAKLSRTIDYQFLDQRCSDLDDFMVGCVAAVAEIDHVGMSDALYTWLRASNPDVGSAYDSIAALERSGARAIAAQQTQPIDIIPETSEEASILSRPSSLLSMMRLSSLSTTLTGPSAAVPSSQTPPSPQLTPPATPPQSQSQLLLPEPAPQPPSPGPLPPPPSSEDGGGLAGTPLTRRRRPQSMAATTRSNPTTPERKKKPARLRGRSFDSPGSVSSAERDRAPTIEELRAPSTPRGRGDSIPVVGPHANTSQITAHAQRQNDAARISAMRVATTRSRTLAFRSLRSRAQRIKWEGEPSTVRKHMRRALMSLARSDGIALQQRSAAASCARCFEPFALLADQVAPLANDGWRNAIGSLRRLNCHVCGVVACAACAPTTSMAAYERAVAFRSPGGTYPSTPLRGGVEDDAAPSSGAGQSSAEAAEQLELRRLRVRVCITCRGQLRRTTVHTERAADLRNELHSEWVVAFASIVADVDEVCLELHDRVAEAGILLRAEDESRFFEWESDTRPDVLETALASAPNSASKKTRAKIKAKLAWKKGKGGRGVNGGRGKPSSSPESAAADAPGHARRHSDLVVTFGSGGGRTGAREIGKRRSSLLVRPIIDVVHHRVVWLLHYLEKVSPSPSCAYALAAETESRLEENIAAQLESRKLCGGVLIAPPLQRRIAARCLRYMERARARPRSAQTIQAVVSLINRALCRSRARNHARSLRTIQGKVTAKAKSRAAARANGGRERSPSPTSAVVVLTTQQAKAALSVAAGTEPPLGVVAPKGSANLFDALACCEMTLVPRESGGEAIGRLFLDAAEDVHGAPPLLPPLDAADNWVLQRVPLAHLKLLQWKIDAAIKCMKVTLPGVAKSLCKKLNTNMKLTPTKRDMLNALIRRLADTLELLHIAHHRARRKLKIEIGSAVYCAKVMRQRAALAEQVKATRETQRQLQQQLDLAATRRASRDSESMQAATQMAARSDAADAAWSESEAAHNRTESHQVRVVREAVPVVLGVFVLIRCLSAEMLEVRAQLSDDQRRRIDRGMFPLAQSVSESLKEAAFELDALQLIGEPNRKAMLSRWERSVAQEWSHGIRLLFFSGAKEAALAEKTRVARERAETEQNDALLPEGARRCTALRPCDGQREDELSFDAGAKIVLLADSGPALSPGWWLGRVDGTEDCGVFPSSMVVVHPLSERSSDSSANLDERSSAGSEDVLSMTLTGCSGAKDRSQRRRSLTRGAAGDVRGGGIEFVPSEKRLFEVGKAVAALLTMRVISTLDEVAHIAPPKSGASIALESAVSMCSQLHSAAVSLCKRSSHAQMEFLAELQARAYAAEDALGPLSDEDSESSHGEGMVDRAFALSAPPALRRMSYHHRSRGSKDNTFLQQMSDRLKEKGGATAGGAAQEETGGGGSGDLVMLLRALDLEHFAELFTRELMVQHLEEAVFDVEAADLLSIAVPPIAIRRFARWQEELRSGNAAGAGTGISADQRRELLKLIDSAPDEREALVVLLAVSPCFKGDTVETRDAHQRRGSALSSLGPRAASVLAVLHGAGVVRLRHLAAEGELLLPPGERRKTASRRRAASNIESVDRRACGDFTDGVVDGGAAIDLQLQGVTIEQTLQLVGEAVALEEMRLLLLSVRLKSAFSRLALGAALPGGEAVRSVEELRRLCVRLSAAELVAILDVSRPALRRLQRALAAAR